MIKTNNPRCIYYGAPEDKYIHHATLPHPITLSHTTMSSACTIASHSRILKAYKVQQTQLAEIQVRIAAHERHTCPTITSNRPPIAPNHSRCEREKAERDERLAKIQAKRRDLAAKLAKEYEEHAATKAVVILANERAKTYLERAEKAEEALRKERERVRTLEEEAVRIRRQRNRAHPYRRPEATEIIEIE